MGSLPGSGAKPSQRAGFAPAAGAALALRIWLPQRICPERLHKQALFSWLHGIFPREAAAGQPVRPNRRAPEPAWGAAPWKASLPPSGPFQAPAAPAAGPSLWEVEPSLGADLVRGPM